jgi:regulator of protease activity HflC (stomatin/prohibitin superfamily)
VGDQERVVLIRDGRFQRILEPGAHTVWALNATLERHSLRYPAFESEWSDFLAQERPEIAKRYFTIVETGDWQVAVVYLDGKFWRVLGPGKRALFWRGAAAVTAEVLDVRDRPEAPAAVAQALARLGRPAAEHVTAAVVNEGQTGLLFINGRFVRALEPGAYAFWNAAGSPRVEIVDLRVQAIEIPGQEILTKDKVAVRVNVWAEYQVTDPALATRTLRSFQEHLYRALQLAVRQTLGRRTLEEILAEKVDIDETVAAEVRREMQAFGVRVGAIALKDIILPGDVREILNQVVTAEKQAQANLIRRREETAATRSLLNTAKLMEDNPLLVRLKELETVEKVAEKVAKITVHGGFDTLLQQLVNLRGS